MSPSRSFQRFFPLFFAALFLCAFSSACGGRISNSKFFEGFGSLQGRFFLPDGRPAAHALLSVVDFPDLLVTTDDTGSFLLQGIPAGRREFVALLPDSHGLRFQVWIVRDTILPLDAPQDTLLPTGTLLGRVTAQHRFGSRGIEIRIKGTLFRTWTRIHLGVFRIDGIPPSAPSAQCHTLLISDPYFLPLEHPDLCVSSGKTSLLDIPLPLSPAFPCPLPPASCPLQATCNHGFCVPESGGESQILQTEIPFGSVPLHTGRSLTVRVLENIGPGPLLISSISLADPSSSFRILELPDLPLSLLPGQSLSLPLAFDALPSSPPFGLRSASLLLHTHEINLRMEARYPAWDPPPPSLQQTRSLLLTAEVIGLSPPPSTTSLGTSSFWPPLPRLVLFPPKLPR